MSRKAIPTLQQSLKATLKQWHNTDRLANESLLASPWFLSRMLGDDLTSAQANQNWVDHLRDAILAAHATLWDAGPPPATYDAFERERSTIIQTPGSLRYCYLVLELRYFNTIYRPRTLQSIWDDFLQQSRAEFYRDLDAAIGALSQRLIVSLRPSALFYAPPEAGLFLGRDALLVRCAEVLREGGSVAISGGSGSGKSTLGARLAAQWQPAPVFWLTIRSSVSDRLGTLLMALADFLHRHGASRLWQALAASGGTLTEYSLALGLAQQDLASLPQPALLCFDEVERWQDGQVAGWIDGLREQATLLLLGQRVPFSADFQHPLSGFSPQTTNVLFKTLPTAPDPATRSALHTLTQGNPRLLRLAVSLLQSGSSAADLLTSVNQHFLFESFLAVLWERLSLAERQLVQQLAVFADPAPSDAFAASAISDLSGRGLLNLATTGTVALLPSVRRVIYADLDGELRDTLHEQAALLFAERGEYTLAADHLQQGHKPAAAVRLWFPYREQEIRRGQADSARRIFGQIAPRRLRVREQKLLRLLRAELDMLLGESQRGLRELNSAEWQSDEPLTIWAVKLRGDFNASLGNYGAALTDFQQGLDMTARLLNEQIGLLDRQSHVHLVNRNTAAAWRTAQMGRYSAELLQGMVQEQRGQYADALVHFEHALALASDQQAVRAMAEAQRRLLKIYGRTQQLAPALQHADAAIAGFESIGDLKKAAVVRANMAAMYLDARRFEDVMHVGGAAQAFFQQTANSLALASVTTNMAEAAFELGDLPEARRLAESVMQLEEPLSQPYALYTLALVTQREGNAEQAEALLATCRELAQQGGDNFITAYAWLKSAEIHQLQGQADAQRRAAVVSAELFQQLGIQPMVDQAKELA